MPAEAIEFIVEPVKNNVSSLCIHTYGCRVI